MKLILSSMLALALAGFPLQVQEPDDRGKPQQQEPKKKPPEPKPQQPDEKSKPERPPKQEPAPPPKQQPPKEQTDDKQRAKQQKEQDKQQKEQAKQDKNRRQQEQAQTTRPGDTRQQTPAKGQRIPPEKFRTSFGREHQFRVARGGGDNRRFQYSGYWFEVVEVWPAGWSFDDDCYIEEVGDDYFLVDIVHPEIRVLVIVVST